MRAACLLALLIVPAVHAQVAGVPAGSAPADSLSATVLPLRSVREAAALAPGVRRDLATGALVFRSQAGLFGAVAEPVFVVDGVRRLGGPLGGSTLALLGAPEVPFAAVRRVGVLAGFVPASLGEAAGGIVLVTTEDAAERFGARLDGLSSEGTAAYGTSLASATLRGPLGALGGFSLTGEARRAGDAVPSAGRSLRLLDGDAAQASPQTVLVRDADGRVRAVAFPAAAAQAALDAGSPLTLAALETLLRLPPGAQITTPNPLTATATLDAGTEQTRTQGDPLRDLALAGQVVLTPAAGRFSVGGNAQRRHASATAPTPAEAFARRLFNRDGLSEQTVDRAGGFAAVDRLRLPAGVTGRARVSVEATRSVLHPAAFSSRVDDALSYGDIDANAVARRSFVFSNGAYVRRFTEDGGAAPSVRSNVGFALPGAPATVYDRQQATSVQASASLARELGAHRVEIGGEVERQTFRRFTLDGRVLAAFAADADGGQGTDGFPTGVARYDQLGPGVLRGLVSAYGYTFNGLATAGDEDVDGVTEGRDANAAPFRPITAGGYVRDVFTAGAARIDVGLRVDLYDARATALLDPYALVPILRAGALASVPAGIGEDFAVYRANALPDGPVVGFRDLDGQFYNAAGTPTTAETVLGERRGAAVQTSAARSEAFTQTPATVRLQPRVSVRVRASDAVTVTVYAARLSRRPDPALYVPFTEYANVLGGSTVAGSAALRPEDVVAVGAGAEIAATSALTVAASVFGRRRRDVAVAQRFDGGFPAYTGVASTGRSDETGVDFEARLAPTRGVSMAATYTFTLADADTAPAADTRHALDLAAEARVPDGGGPRLGGVAPFGGLGVGVVVAAQSGLAYTALSPDNRVSVFDAFTPDVRGEIGGARLPWTVQADVRVERRFALGAAALTAFVWAENVLGTRNTLAVYRATGRPDSDGFAATEVGQQTLAGPGAQAGYAAYVGGPVGVGGVQSTGAPFVYGQPRQVRVGVVLGL